MVSNLVKNINSSNDKIDIGLISSNNESEALLSMLSSVESIGSDSSTEVNIGVLRHDQDKEDDEILHQRVPFVHSCEWSNTNKTSTSTSRQSPKHTHIRILSTSSESSSSSAITIFESLQSVSNSSVTHKISNIIPQVVHLLPEPNKHAQLCYHSTKNELVVTWLGDDIETKTNDYMEGPFDPFLDDVDAWTYGIVPMRRKISSSSVCSSTGWSSSSSTSSDDSTLQEESILGTIDDKNIFSLGESDEDYLIDLSEIRVDDDGMWLLAPIVDEIESFGINMFIKRIKYIPDHDISLTCGEVILKSFSKFINVTRFGNNSGETTKKSTKIYRKKNQNTLGSGSSTSSSFQTFYSEYTRSSVDQSCSIKKAEVATRYSKLEN